MLLARALVGQPDLLLLDEPTNHLDIDAITWLETFLADYPGAVVFVTHDRAFLQRLATRIVELDRGRLTSWPGDYATFLRKKEEWLANEAVQQEKFDKKLAEEEVWLRQGIKARRTRNEGRVRALMAMRAERAARRDAAGHGAAAGRAGRAVGPDGVRGRAASARRSATTGRRRDFSTRDHARRSHRPDRAERRRQDDAAAAAARRAARRTRARCGAAPTCRSPTTISSASSSIPSARCSTRSATATTPSTVNGQPRHVHGYLRDFLFSPERARSPVKALSGGERNRLLLARLFTRPANVLVLDEPTNDLDLETLELLEAQLVEWPGTLLLVSHDRAFLDNVVTSTLVFEGDGRVAGVRRRLRGLAAAARAAWLPAAKRVGERAGRTPADGARPRRRSCRTTSSASSTAAGAHRGARGRAAGARRHDRGPGILQAARGRR